MGQGVTGVFRRFVAVGDSLSQGTWNGGTEAASQRWGVPAVVARQVGIEFRQPWLAAPGNPPQIWPVRWGGRDESGRRAAGQRLEPDAVIDNFAVPGATVGDLLGLSPARLATAVRPGMIKSLVRRVLNPAGRPEWEALSQLDRAIAARPSLVHVMIGANDVLEPFFHPGTRPTPPVIFAARWRRVLQRLLTETEAVLIVVLVPEVHHVPAVRLHRRPRLLHRCAATVAAYNEAIVRSVVGQSRIVLVDAAAGLRAAAQGGVPVPGRLGAVRVPAGRLTLSAPVGCGRTLWRGGLLSYDGLHPSQTGYALLANGVLEALNARLGCQVPLGDLAEVAAEDPLLQRPNPWFWAVSQQAQRVLFRERVEALERQDWRWVAR